MATTTSQIRAVVTALHTLVEARPALADVRVFRYAPSPRDVETVDEYIVLCTRIDGRQDALYATANIRTDNFTLHGVIELRMPGAGDDIADDAHARAEALLAEIEAVLQPDPMLGRSNTHALLGAYEHTYGADENDRLHLLTFEIDIREQMFST